jgi:hypothetical protein
MRRLKAAKPATAGAVNGLHAVSAGRPKRCDADTPTEFPTQALFLALYDGQRCLGHLLPRGKLGVEAYDADDRSLGLFPDQKTAADAVSQKAGGVR